MSYVTFTADKLTVPTELTLPFIEGDGIGPEITAALQRVTAAALAKTLPENKIIWQEVLAGEKAFRQTGSWLPPETLTTIKQAKLAIKGPLTTPIGEGHRSLNVTLRQELDLYACVRPVRYFPGVPTPVKEPEKTAITIFRENTEDLYAGIEFAAETPEVKALIETLPQKQQVKLRFPATSALGIKPISKTGSQRLVAAAMDYCLTHNKKRLTLVHKGNIMKFTEGGFKKWGYALLETHYPEQVFTLEQFNRLKKAHGLSAAQTALTDAQATHKVIVDDLITDNCFQQMLLAPENYQVLATTNLNGDYLSDALAAQVGGIGISPGANINYQTGAALFEATHGTAPDIAGQGLANPCSLLLSMVMLLEYIGWHQPAKAIETAIADTLEQKIVTHDFAQTIPQAQEVSTADFATALIEQIEHS